MTEANLSALRASLPVEQIAQRIGANPAETAAAIDTLLPSLMGGLQANAQDPARAASLANALGQHEADPAAIDPASIDAEDGQRIVRNIFGDHTDEVVHRLGGASAGGGSLVRKLLPILAPIVLSWLASQLAGKLGGGAGTGAGQGGAAQGDAGQGGLGGIVGQILNGVFPGGGAGGAGGASGGLGDVLGSVLGGGGGSRPSADAPPQPAPDASADGSTSSVRMPDAFGRGAEQSGPAAPAEPAEPAAPASPAGPAAPAESAAPAGGSSLKDLLGGLLGHGKR